MYAKVVRQNDNYMFDINGKLFVPAAFRSFRPTPANVSLFYRNGIRLFQMQVCGIDNTLQLPYSNYGGVWVGDHQYDFTPFDRQISMFRKFAPDGYFMIMLPLDTPDWWLKENHCEYDSYYHLGEAYYNQKWRQDASDYLQAFIRYAEEKYLLIETAQPVQKITEMIGYEDVNYFNRVFKNNVKMTPTEYRKENKGKV